MKINRIILFTTIAALAGLGAGYLLFGGKQTPAPAAPSENQAAGSTIWTCSMHPQIRQNEPGSCPICGMDLIPLGEMQTDNPLVLEMTPEAVQLANIRTVEVGSQPGSSGHTLLLTGKVQADERQMASQVAHISGRVEQLFVSFTGETIRKGQKLATLYAPELVTAQRELIEAKKWAGAQPQLLEAARNKLRYWKIPDSTISAVEQSGRIQSTMPVYADQGGIVMQRRVAVGDYVREGSVLFDIADLNRLWILFDAYEEDLANVRVGSLVRYAIPAIPDRTFTARISFIDPVIHPQTRVASLRAEVANPGGLLKPEMLVRGTVRQQNSNSGKGLYIPKSAILWTGTRSVAYVEVPDVSVPSFAFREVTIEGDAGDYYRISGGIEPGERVVENGAFMIDAAAQLNNMASMMNRQVKVTGAKSSAPDYTGQTPEVFLRQLEGVLNGYLQIKDALVRSDPAAAIAASQAMQQAVQQVDMTLLAGAAHRYWMQQQDAILAHGQKIERGGEIEEQRKQFSFLTGVLINVMSAFGHTGTTLYLQHCPMAFEDTGADWLSTDAQIRNPYFGDQMLKCGVTRDSF
ncbi:MAG: DUF3347 domain-containing protein [Bacteroidetes bacterium]|nr:MAG: DUF3347 domain-containing protein [Bacteroidota bacterium]